MQYCKKHTKIWGKEILTSNAVIARNGRVLKASIQLFILSQIIEYTRHMFKIRDLNDILAIYL